MPTPEIKLPTKQEATTPAPTPAAELPAPKIVAGTALKCGQYVELAGVAIYQVNKVPSQIERKDKDPVEIPGSASLVVGNCTQRYIELWPSRNYHLVDYKPAGSVTRQSPVQKGSTTTDTMTTSKPQA